MNTARPDAAALAPARYGSAGWPLAAGAVLLFAGCSALTVHWSLAMSSMAAMTMPGGWSMSMMWMRGSGQSWLGATAHFTLMWAVMMVAMMLPVLVPILCRQPPPAGDMPPGVLNRLRLRVAGGYFTVWTLWGVPLFALCSGCAALAMGLPALARAAPLLLGVLACGVGAWQLSRQKGRLLARCRAACLRRHGVYGGAADSWRHGMQLGLRCSQCCAGMTTLLLALGAMDLRVMSAVAALTAAERLLPAALRAAQISGTVLLTLGALQVVRVMLHG